MSSASHHALVFAASTTTMHRSGPCAVRSVSAPITRDTTACTNGDGGFAVGIASGAPTRNGKTVANVSVIIETKKGCAAAAPIGVLAPAVSERRPTIRTPARRTSYVPLPPR